MKATSSSPAAAGEAQAPRLVPKPPCGGGGQKPAPWGHLRWQQGWRTDEDATGRA
jgi:hypothetical protein